MQELARLATSGPVHGRAQLTHSVTFPTMSPLRFRCACGCSTEAFRKLPQRLQSPLSAYYAGSRQQSTRLVLSLFKCVSRSCQKEDVNVMESGSCPNFQSLSFFCLLVSGSSLCRLVSYIPFAGSWPRDGPESRPRLLVVVRPWHERDVKTTHSMHAYLSPTTHSDCLSSCRLVHQ